jgi:hypothetical protein
LQEKKTVKSGLGPINNFLKKSENFNLPFVSKKGQLNYLADVFGLASLLEV